MRKKKRSIVSRPVKAIAYLLLALLLVLTIYIGLGSPPQTVEMAFRRAERAHMVGPGTILGKFSNGQQYPRSVIIAETEDSHILYVDQRQPLGYRRFYANPKEGQIDNYTLRAYPKTGLAVLYTVSTTNASPVQLVLFDRNSKAVRAEMETTVTFLYRDDLCTMDIRAESVREYNRFFLFSLSKPQGSTEQWYYAMAQLIRRYREPGASTPEVTIRLYDAQGDLIETHSFTPGQNDCWQKR